VALEPIPPTDTRALFRPLSAEFVALLRTLPADAWTRPTVAGAWRVRDVLAHLVDVTARRLSFHRDGHPPPAFDRRSEFVAFINDLNARWIAVAGRMSPRVLTTLYSTLSDELATFVETIPMDAPALFPVSWAGEESSAGWFDVGREFTEVWHHQQQIRDAVGAPAPANPDWLRAFLLIALRGLPHAYRDLRAAPGDTVVLRVSGSSGGIWTIRREAEGWSLWAGVPAEPSTVAELSDDTAWRLLFNALPPATFRERVRIQGNAGLAAPLDRARSVIV
jgi:uncharacterized protein (TIGR03083 family)